jgi:predicted signal transduction protein with EAL and GGDEF domain
VAQRLVGALREDDRIARVGGDEFAVLLSDVADRAVVATLAARIINSITAPHLIGGSQMRVTVSIGISVYRGELTKPEDIMREADLALYEAKGSGRDKYVFHSEALDLAVRERVTMIEELRAALDRGEFEVYYQPQVEVPSRQIVGVEALLRWNHPSRGLLTPGRFIAIAEKTGMIGPIGQWVLADVRRQLRIWNNDGIGPPVTSVNLSAAQLISPSNFLRDLMQGLSADGLDPGRLELELTESLLMETTRGHGDMVNQLRALGVRIAIDDFGTGYSSLEYLLVYRVSRIKIAQQFVDGLPGDPGSAAIVRATIGLAREFGIEIIAEGVETAAQLEFLVGAGCRCIQGFYFSRPVPAGQATRLLRQGVLEPAVESETAARPADGAEPEGARA